MGGGVLVHPLAQRHCARTTLLRHACVSKLSAQPDRVAAKLGPDDEEDAHSGHCVTQPRDLPRWPAREGGSRPSRAHVRTREVDTQWFFSDHLVMPAFPRCGALLRDGQPCRRTVVPGSDFCAHHNKLLASVDAETMRQGRTPKRHSTLDPVLRVVTDPVIEREAIPAARTVAIADPANVRPSLAAAAAENVEQLKSSLLEAAGSAVRPVWLTVECTACGKRSRIEAPVPDVRARVAAIELLLREGLGRPATAEEVRPTRMPTTVDAVKAMSWDDMQALFAATYADEIAAVLRDGGGSLLREKLAVLSDDERRALRTALEAA